MKVTVLLLITCIALSGCFGESKTYGIKNSEWSSLSESQKFDIEKTYHEKQRLADQLKMNEAIIKQNKKLAKVREENEKAQNHRLKEEADRLKSQLKQKESDLKSKHETYVHPVEKTIEVDVSAKNESAAPESAPTAETKAVEALPLSGSNISGQ